MRRGILLWMVWNLVSSVALAAPLTDYAAGNLAVDVSLRTVENESTVPGGTHNMYSARSGMDFGVTAGLGGRWALKYRGLNAVSQDKYFTQIEDDWIIDPNYESYKEQMRLRTSEVNLLYQWNRYCSFFLGSVRARAKFSYTYQYHDPLYPKDNAYESGGIHTKAKSATQFGVIGSMPLAPKLTGYASVGAGKDVASMSVGLSYTITRNMDFNVDYRRITVKRLRLEDAELEARTSGLGFGVTYCL